MATTIQLLSEQAINQIAAGEVIENPASVVKELVENSLDAGASAITIDIEAGGRQLIRVSDNGRGMSSSDATLCFARHATSKIRDSSDLASIATMGFRGEALPSIAAIARVELTSAQEEAAGYRVCIEGGKQVAAEVAAHSQGTTITVRNLFYNVPVRQKFQKSVAHDNREIAKVVTKIALAHPNVRFTLHKGGVIVVKTGRSETLHKRIATLIGEEFARDGISVEGGSLCGLLAGPTHHRASRSGQYLFINRRPVYSRLVSEAVAEGFGTRLPAQRHPLFVLHLTLDGEAVDVNVHPQKREVRFQNKDRVRRAIVDAIEQALGGGAAPTNPLPWEQSGDGIPHTIPPPLLEKGSETPLPFSIDSVGAPSAESTSYPPLQDCQKPHRVAETFVTMELPIQVIGIFDRYVIVNGQTLPEQWRSDGLVVVNAQAAQARILYEELVANRRSSSSQTLAIPITIKLLADEAALVLEQLEELNQLGWSVRSLGGGSLIVDGLPAAFASVDVERFFLDLASDLKRATKQDRQVARLASQWAARVVKTLTTNEAQRLLQRLFETKTPAHSPHGKPTFVQISPKELARRFQ